MKNLTGIKTKPIGVFDSGFGGLEILREIVDELPEYDYIYLGDTARSPYGSHSQEVIYNFTLGAIKFLFNQDCPLLILACNTASSTALRKIQREYLSRNFPERRVLGVIIPVTEEAAGKTKNGRIGVMATESTVRSEAFEKELKKLDPKIRVFQEACPLLVSIVEEGERDSKLTKLVLEKYLTPLMSKNIDTLILGCTHYGLLKKEIEKVVGENINIIAEGEVIAGKLKNYLKRHPEVEKNLNKNSKIKFLTTDLTEKFKILGSQFFGKEISPEKISLE